MGRPPRRRLSSSFFLAPTRHRPGAISIRAIRGPVEPQGLSEEEATRRIAATNPQRRIIPAEEVAEAVALARPGSIPSPGGHPLMLSGGA